MSPQKSPRYEKPIPLSVTYNGRILIGMARPLEESGNSKNNNFHIVLEEESLGTIHREGNNEWTMEDVENKELVHKIGEEIRLWFKKSDSIPDKNLP